MLSISTNGLQNRIAGIDLPTDVSTGVLYFAFLVVLFQGKYSFYVSHIIITVYIIVFTFILNYSKIDIILSLKQFLGIVIYSFIFFNIKLNINSLYRYITFYYQSCIVFSIISFLQIFLFVFTGYSFLPQNLIAGRGFFSGGESFTPEIFDFIPRAVSIFTEPAHYSVILLPSVYIAILVLTNKFNSFRLRNKYLAFLILTSFLLTFSVVGYIGLLFIGVSIFFRNSSNKFKSAIYLILFGSAAFSLIIITPIGGKITSMINASQQSREFNYTSSDQTSFALISNFVVAYDNLFSTNFLGSGLYSHAMTYDKLIDQIFSFDQIPGYLNRENAGSLIIRILSEFGIPGLLLFFFFLFKRHKNLTNNKNPDLEIIAGIFVVSILGYAIRNGQYLSNTLFFYICILLNARRLLEKSNSLQFEIN